MEGGRRKMRKRAKEEENRGEKIRKGTVESGGSFMKEEKDEKERKRREKKEI